MLDLEPFEPIDASVSFDKLGNCFEHPDDDEELMLDLPHKSVAIVSHV